MNYAGTFSNGLGSSTFTDMLPPVGTQVRRLCLVLVLSSGVQGFRLIDEVMAYAGTSSNGLGGRASQTHCRQLAPRRAHIPCNAVDT
jgi:hypothetical protein